MSHPESFAADRNLLFVLKVVSTILLTSLLLGNYEQLVRYVQHVTFDSVKL